MRRVLFACVMGLLIFGLSAPSAVFAIDNVDVLIASPKPYGKLKKEIKALGGTIRIEYKNIDAVAATIPRDQVDAVKGLRSVSALRRDMIMSLPSPPTVNRPGFGSINSTVDIAAGEAFEETVAFSDIVPAGYFTTEVGLTRALDFWIETGHAGEGVIIAIMDSGTAPVPALGTRVIGGESFLWATPSLDDGLGPNSPFNGSHGTQVATAAGADVAFLFNGAGTFAQSIKTHLPDAIVPDFPVPGTDLVPMVGQAPLAEFFALKVFNVNGRTSNAILLAAFDGAIELKELHDAGDPEGVNLQVLNGSWSGGSLFSADDPFFAAMIQEVHEAGIVTCFSASNDGPSAMTIGDPALARNSLAVGATNVAAYERILRDLQYGLGAGSLYRASDSHQTATFSSRGPAADGRFDPDITAPGFAIFMQGADGGLSVGSGTSFSSPMVAGAAALLLSADPSATPDEIRAALLQGANPHMLEDNSGPNDQGFGFLDVMAAYEHLQLGTENPPDEGLEKNNVHVNARRTGVNVVKSSVFSDSTGWLLPGETLDYAIETTNKPLTGLTVFLTVTAELPPGEQNFFFGDDMMVEIHSAKTSAFGDYRAEGFVPGTAVFQLGPQDLESGLTRVTLVGDWTNAGKVKADITVVKDFDPPGQNLWPLGNGRIDDGESLPFTVEVPAGQSELNIYLGWKGDWGKWPTNDLDILVYDPNFNLILLDNDGDGDYDGLSADSPERLTIPDPEEGSWFIFVDGFTIWDGTDNYYLFTNIK